MDPKSAEICVWMGRMERSLGSPLGAALLLLLHGEGPWCLEGLRPQGTPKLRGRFLVLSGAPYKSWDCTAGKMLPFSWGHLK